MKKILITGASGYIGSCLMLFLKKKFKLIGLDKKEIKFISIKKCDLKNLKKLTKIVKYINPSLTVHLAAQSLVDETINRKKYFINNVLATKNLVYALKKNNLDNLVFSSTASVYKYKNQPLKENSKIYPKSYYAKTKYECENIIKKSKLNSIVLRFFNVSSSLKIKNNITGEYHNPETHLIPTVVYKNLLRKKIYIYGRNYKTKDGTCIRDYINIKDICGAIEKSINFLLKNNNKFEIINIGSSSKNTNLDILKNVEKITKIKSICEITKKRKGDVDLLICSNYKANKILNWKPSNSNLKKIIKDELAWTRYLLKNKKFRKFKNYL